MSIKLEKNTLRPLIILRISSTKTPLPIIGKTNLFKLRNIRSNILFSYSLRFHFMINCILLSPKTKSIKSHRMKYIISLEHLFSSNRIWCYISFWVTNMKTCSTRIRKHIQNIEFWLSIWFLCLIYTRLLPLFLPFLSKHFHIYRHLLYTKG